MVVRTVGAVVTLLVGLGGVGSLAWAQYYPPPRAYPPPQAYPPAQGYPPYRPLPSVDAVDDEDEEPIYDSPVQSRPLPPPSGMGAQADEPPPSSGHRYGSRAPVYPEQAEPPAPPSHRYGGRPQVYPDQELPPPAASYRDLPPGYPPPDPAIARGRRPAIVMGHRPAIAMVAKPMSRPLPARARIIRKIVTIRQIVTPA
jgi:hypothetical protein